MTLPPEPEPARRPTAQTVSTASTVTLAVFVAALLVLHVWPVGGPLGRERSHPSGAFDAIPWDLAYPLLWMAAAWAAIIFLVRRVWTDPTDGSAPEASPEPLPENGRGNADSDPEGA